MSTTASIMVGASHQLSGEFLPTHLIRLEETSRPAWIVQAIGPLETETWLPHDCSRILVDLLGCIAVNVLGVDRPERIGRGTVEPTPDLDSVVDGLAEAARRSGGVALALTVWPGSSLLRFRSDLEHLDLMDVEIFESAWSRRRNRWSNSWVVSDDDVAEQIADA